MDSLLAEIINWIAGLLTMSYEGWFLILRETGLAVPILTILALIAFTIILEKCFKLRQSAILLDDREEVLYALERGINKQIEHSLKDLPQPQSDLVRTAHASRMLDKQDLLNEIAATGSRWIRTLSRRLGLLHGIGRASPLIGFLGTIIALLRLVNNTYLATSLLPANPLEQALLSSAAGLAVGIPVLFFHDFFERRLKEISCRFEEYGHELNKAIHYDFKTLEHDPFDQDDVSDDSNHDPTTLSSSETEQANDPVSNPSNQP